MLSYWNMYVSQAIQCMTGICCFSSMFFFFEESANSELEQYRTTVMAPRAQRASSDAKQSVAELL